MSAKPEVGMLDTVDMTLHLPGGVHLVTKCGVTMNECQVGPYAVLQAKARRFCTDCHPEVPR